MSRHSLGQHFLHSESIASEIVSSAHLCKDDTVLEIGTGLGILTKLLCIHSKHVISIETDHFLYKKAKNTLDMDNLTLVHSDAFKTDYDFKVLVSNLPYSKSKTAIEWLARRTFSHAIIMVQKEFADKLLDKTKAISVIANYCFEIKKILDVQKSNFSPPPKVDSVVLYMTKKHTLDVQTIHAINLIFSYRRKTISNIMKKFDIQNPSQKRLDQIHGDEIINLGRKIANR